MSPIPKRPSPVLLGREHWKILIAGAPDSGKSPFLQLLNVAEIKQGEAEAIDVEELSTSTNMLRILSYALKLLKARDSNNKLARICSVRIREFC